MDDFTPSNSGNGNSEYTGEQKNYPTPKGGSRRARVSLIVDLGTQERESLWKVGDKIVEPNTEGATEHEQKPAQQVAVFADLVNDTVDYGGDIGKAHYRLLLNNIFAGKLKGVNFGKVPPMDAKGKRIEGKEWTMHPQNLLTKLAKACDRDDVVVSAKINQLLGLPFMATVEVKETTSDKKDGDGNPIVYKNVNYKGASKVAAEPTGETDGDGNDIEAVPEFNKCKVEPLCITFSNAKKEDIKYIRSNIVKMIKLAQNYTGSNMQKAIEAFEAERDANKEAEGDKKDPSAVAKEKPKAAPKPAKKVVDNADDSDVPF